jgi:aryl-phospho-beta-D-glucosidase BglC (GH1 family)
LQTRAAQNPAADINKDGSVDVLDMSIMLSNWGKTGAADINTDGTVGVTDLSILLSSWGPVAGTGTSTFTLNDFTTGTGLNQFQFVGSWNPDVDPPAYQGDEHWTLSAGAYYQVKFTGTQIKIFSTVDKSGGIMAVSIDGGTETMVDTYASARANQVGVYTSPTLTNATHTLKVRVTGTKNAAATNVGIVADRVDITGTPTATPTPTPTPTPLPPGTLGPRPTVARGFMSTWLNSATPSYFQAMRTNWKANLVRLQVHPRDMANQMGKPLDQAWPTILTKIDQAITDANAVGIHVIVDLHQSPFPYAVSERSTMWSDPNLEMYFVDAWTRIAEKLKYRQGVGIWGYDLFNEPENNGAVPSQWRPLAQKLVNTIRAIDSTPWIVYDPSPNAQPRGYVGLTPLVGERIVYTWHDYNPHEFTHQSLGGWPAVANYPYTSGSTTWDLAKRRVNMQPIRDFQLKYNVPILVGEFSVIRWAPKADALLWFQEGMDLYEQYGWSWTYHAFREWDGWSLEHDENKNNPAAVNYVTERGKIIMQAMQKNP